MQLQNEASNLIKVKQDLFLEKILITDKERTKVFTNKANLKLSKLGFTLAIATGLTFKELKFEPALTIRELKDLCELNKEIFYVIPTLDKAYVSDFAFSALYTLLNGNKKLLF